MVPVSLGLSHISGHPRSMSRECEGVIIYMRLYSLLQINRVEFLMTPLTDDI